MSPHRVEAFVGKYNLTNKSEVGSKGHLVWEIVIHPDWKYDHHKYEADIAILVLVEAAKFNIFVQPVCLPSKNDKVVTGTGSVAGWGKSTHSDDAYKPTPFVLRLPAIDDGVCYTTFDKLARSSSPRSFCGGFVNQSKATCTGDSGGGMHFMNRDAVWTIRGIVSGGLITAIIRCDVNAYTLFTNVAKFRDWIIDVMERTTTNVWEKWNDKSYACENAGYSPDYPSDDGYLRCSTDATSNSALHRPWRKFTSSSDVLPGYSPSPLINQFHFELEQSNQIFGGIGVKFPNLSLLRLSGKSVEFVERRNFASMSRLTSLHLDGLSIDFLPDDLLADLPKLISIKMTSCAIDEIPEKLFEYQSRLKILVLSGNRLTALKEYLFKSNPKLEKVYLRGNHLMQINVDFTELFAINKINMKDNDCMSRTFDINIKYIKDDIIDFQDIVESCCGAAPSDKSSCWCFPESCSKSKETRATRALSKKIASSNLTIIR